MAKCKNIFFLSVENNEHKNYKNLLVVMDFKTHVLYQTKFVNNNVIITIIYI